MTDYAKRMRACEGNWKFAGGMEVRCKDEVRRVVDVYPHGYLCLSSRGDREHNSTSKDERWTPNITNDATKGCLVAQIRKRFPFFHTMNWEGLDDISWECSGINDAVDHENYKTEEAIIMAALEAL